MDNVRTLLEWLTPTTLAAVYEDLGDPEAVADPQTAELRYAVRSIVVALIGEDDFEALLVAGAGREADTCDEDNKGAGGEG